MIWLFFAVPPQAQRVLSRLAIVFRSLALPDAPWITVTVLPHLLVSRLTVTLCCSLVIVPQTHISFGSPQTGQISTMLRLLGSFARRKGYYMYI